MQMSVSSRASRNAIARPMPLAPPVMSATRRLNIEKLDYAIRPWLHGKGCARQGAVYLLHIARNGMVQGSHYDLPRFCWQLITHSIFPEPGAFQFSCNASI